MYDSRDKDWLSQTNLYNLMRHNIVQQNPYQVKNKRFKRKYDQTEHFSRISSSRQKYKSSSALKTLLMCDNRMLDSSLKKNQIKDLPIFCNRSRNQSQQKKSIVKSNRPQKIQNNGKVQQQQKIQNLQQIVKKKEERIQHLQSLLNQKVKQNKQLKDQLNIIRKLNQQISINFEKSQIQIQKLQLQNSEEIYKLTHKLKKNQIELSCTSKKWRDQFDKIVKQKDQQIKGLRQKFNNLLKFNKEKSKNHIFATHQILSPHKISLERKPLNESLELSSFQLSK